MRLRMIATVASASALLGFGAAQAADIEWEVNNPFRFYKVDSSFALHEKAFAEVRGDANGPIPPDVIWRIERRLNDPDCKDPSTPANCAATKRAHYEERRLGWAAKTLPTACYDNIGRPRRYPGQRTQPCANTLTIERVPYSTHRANSGVAVKVKLPNGRELEEQDVTVEDLLVVGLGDSFASGDSNPDRPVSFSASRQMVYDPVNFNTREEMAMRSYKRAAPKKEEFDLASADDAADPKA